MSGIYDCYKSTRALQNPYGFGISQFLYSRNISHAVQGRGELQLWENRESQDMMAAAMQYANPEEQ